MSWSMPMSKPKPRPVNCVMDKLGRKTARGISGFHKWWISCGQTQVLMSGISRHSRRDAGIQAMDGNLSVTPVFALRSAPIHSLPSSIKILLFAFLLLDLGMAQADWAGFSRFAEVAEIAVEPDGIRLNLRLAQNAVPPGLALADPAPSDPPPWLASRLPLLLGENGKPLTGRLQALGKAGADAKDGGKDAYEAILSYPLEAQARRLTLVPPPDQPAIGLVVLHRGVPVSDLMPLEKKARLSLDWNDPWASRFDDPAFARRHAEPRSYVYVEPYEVRHELLVRLKDLKPWLDLGLKDPRSIEDAEREAVKRKIGAFLLQRNPLQVDGASLAPQLDRVEFVRFSRAGVLPVAEPGRLDTDTVLVGVVLAYLTESPARAITLRWDLFEGASGQRQVNLNWAKESFDAYMTPKQPVFEWSAEESFDPVPVPEEAADASPSPTVGKAVPPLSPSDALLALLLVLAVVLFMPSGINRKQWGTVLGMVLIVAVGGAFHPRPGLMAGDGAEPAPGLDEARAKPLLQSLLHNAYRAFQLRDEEKAYDRLAKSLDGDLLDDIYLQQRRALLRQAEGMGGEGKVNRIEVLEAKVLPLGRSPGAFQVMSRWMAHGTVSHWGHSHERHNLYQARLKVRAMEDGLWKIVGLEFLDGRRLEQGGAG